MHACLIPVKGYVNLEAEIVHATLWGQRISGRAIGGGTGVFSSATTRLPPHASRFAKTAPPMPPPTTMSMSWDMRREMTKLE